MVVIVDRRVGVPGVSEGGVDGGGRGVALGLLAVLEMAERLNGRGWGRMPRRSSWGPLMMDWWRQ